MPNSAVTLRNVDLTYSGRQGPVIALKNVSISANAGEFVSIVGPSGCGKSTILKIVSGLIPSTAGSVLVHGMRVDGPPPSIGVVFQSAQLMPWRNILDNVLLQIEMRGLPIAKYREEARALLRMVGLSAFERSLPYQLSGGMQQRVGICRALVHAPDLLVMDEPFGALDAMTREQMMLELQRIWMERKTTVLFITHSLSEAIFLSDRVVVMSPRPGRVVGEFEVPMTRPRLIKDERSETFTSLSDLVRDCLERAGAIPSTEAPHVAA
jgi:NitT/TauT family transport system ATP-binding protein